MRKTEWIQNYATIKVDEKNKEIALKEYDSAVKQLEIEEKLFSNTVTVFSAIITISISIFLTNKNTIDPYLTLMLDNSLNLIIIILFLAWFTRSALVYFSQKQKHILYSQRKIVVIREMMGWDYTPLQNILPASTVHGASNPFSINNKPAYLSFPCILLSLSSSLILLYFLHYIPFQAWQADIWAPILFFLAFCKSLSTRLSSMKLFVIGLIFYVCTTFFINSYNDNYGVFLILILMAGIIFLVILSSWLNNPIKILGVKFFLLVAISILYGIFITTSVGIFFSKQHVDVFCTLFWLLSCIAVYQKHLFDKYENFILIIGKFIAKVVNFRLHDNLQYIIYRAQLSIVEMERMNIDISLLSKYLIAIEDNRFYTRHTAIDYKSLLRAFAYHVYSKCEFLSKLYPLSKHRNQRAGGSTITQQVFRTIFISEPFHKKKYRRKLFELYFSTWMESVYSKDEILLLYLSSVRFESKIMGATKAIKFFFSDHQFNDDLSKAQAFFLIERLSEINSSINSSKIRSFISRFSDNKILYFSSGDEEELYNIYAKLIKEEKLKKPRIKLIKKPNK